MFKRIQNLIIIIAIITLYLGGCKKGENKDNSLLWLFFLNGSSGPPQLYFSYQLNTNILSQYGAFFHRQKNFPGFQEYTDFTAVKLNPELETTEQDGGDHNWFALDGKTGVILFSMGTRSYSAYQNDALKGATAFAVAPNGKLAIITSTGDVNLCHSFTGAALQVDGACAGIAAGAKYISTETSNNFVFVDTSGAIHRVNGATGVVSPLTIWSDIENPADIYANDQVLALIDKAGMRVRIADKSGLTYTEADEVSPVIFSYQDGNGNWQQYGAPVNGITRNKNGYYFVVSSATNQGAILKPNLEPYARISYPSIPAPGIRVQNELGVSMHAASGMVYIFAKNSVTALSETVLESAAVSYDKYVPSEAMTVVDAIRSLSLEELKNSPDVMQIPEVKSALEQAMKELKYNLE